MQEILQGLWNAFAPFIGKAVIAIIVVGFLGLGINLITHKFQNKDKR